MVGAVKGYRVMLTMPESMSIERRRLLAAYGAELVLTPKEKGMPGAIEKAEQLAEELDDVWIPQQFTNPANVQAHIENTAQEILRDFPEGFDYLITGVGTGGHISGCAEVLKQRFRHLKVFAVEPELSPVISGGQPGPHPLQGIGAGFVPKNLNAELLDGIIKVGQLEGLRFCSPYRLRRRHSHRSFEWCNLGGGSSEAS
jgi:cysteine synthase A